MFLGQSLVNAVCRSMDGWVLLCKDLHDAGGGEGCINIAHICALTCLG